MSVVRVATAQVNPTVGDLEGNLEIIVDAYGRAAEAGADLVAFPELVISGYPPEDLLLKPRFVTDDLAVLQRFAAQTGECVAIVGFVEHDGDLFNAAALCARGAIVGVYRKRLLPNYAVFDEERYFNAGSGGYQLYRVAGVDIGLSICEDIWYPAGPVAEQAAGGAVLNININASPFEAGKAARRRQMIANRALDARCAVVYVNQVGGQDELVFDGASMVVDADGRLIAQAPQFVSDVMLVDVPILPAYQRRSIEQQVRPGASRLPVVTVTERRRVEGSEPVEEIAVPIATATAADRELYDALVLGTRDYCRKNRFDDVVIGLSGGIDSSLVACVAVEALGARHVHGVAMPSRYSSDHSLEDAQALADNLGIDLQVISIEPAYQAYLDMLALDISAIGDRARGLTLENLQSRCRGQVLMALSNEFGWMVLTTGNKSELAVGYFTIYGDSVGGYGVIKDVLKTRVYDLCRLVNASAGRSIIPERVLTKAPSAELRPDQRDDQSLPPYSVLDPILELYIEQDCTAAEIIEAGHDPELVRRITGLVDAAEYKRRQGPPGVRVSAKAFGKDRRMPITNRYRG